MNKEYLERNALGYEGDTFVHGEIRKLVEKFDINLIVETGTYKGATTKRLREFAPVISFEIDPGNYQASVNNTKGIQGIEIVNENSVDGLRKGFALYMLENRLYFLDAHWGEYWPLLDELKTIADTKEQPVIIIHDFQVPGKDFGYDEYKGIPLNFDYIKSAIEGIYGTNGYGYHYNEKADGACRGLIYIYPKI